MTLYVQQVGGLETNCYIVASEKNSAAIIDPGADANAIINSLETYQLAPVFILLTHGHFDHIGAANALRSRYSIPVYANEQDLYLLKDTTRNRARYHKVTQEDYHVVPNHFIKEGDVLALDELRFQILETPGHTKGGICAICGDLLFSGDTLFLGDIGYTHFQGGSYSDMEDSLRKLRDLSGDYTVLPGHGSHTTLENERQKNKYILKLVE